MEPGKQIIPHLFRTEYSKITAVLCRVFGIAHIEIAEDLVSDTFLLAAETWGLKGAPKNPKAWLYTVAKNKAKDYFKRDNLFTKKIAAELNAGEKSILEPEIDLSDKNIGDSQLQMMFAVCHPCIPVESQIGLSLSILCGFGVEEIADAFLSSKESIYKRLSRAKDKLRAEKVQIAIPTAAEIDSRLGTVLSTLYLLFNEGYYSVSQNAKLRKELCVEAMRLNLLLIENKTTNLPQVNALLSLMCFHASRFEARIDGKGALVLYEEQDSSLWDKELIKRGEYFLNAAATGNEVSKYHLEAAIAYWHTHQADSKEKWESVLQLYNKLLLVEYSPMAALNRTFALSKARDKAIAIAEAEKLDLGANHFYHCLMGDLFTGFDDHKAMQHLETALSLARSADDKLSIKKKMDLLKVKNKIF
ncbi:MAG TPA: sigma factor [Bacteroidia bacterium]|nr:sigma factor [Bacteroidia bacterium]